MKNPVLMIKSIQIAVDHEKNRGMNSTLVAKFAQEKYIEISDSPNTSVTESGLKSDKSEVLQNRTACYAVNSLLSGSSSMPHLLIDEGSCFKKGYIR